MVCTPRRLHVVLATALAIAVLAMAVLATGCQQPGVKGALERSSAPILVPSGEWQEAFEFTAPPGTTDLYQLRWNFKAGATNVVTGWQIASTTTYDQVALAEGPGDSLVDEALRASRAKTVRLPTRTWSYSCVCIPQSPLATAWTPTWFG